MKKVKSFLVLFLLFSVFLTIFISGCGQTNSDEMIEPGTNEASNTVEVDSNKIGATVEQPTSNEAASVQNDTASGEVKNVYVVSTNKDPYVVSMADNFIKALADNGFKDGQNIKITTVNIEGDFSKYPSVIEDIKASKPDVVFSDCSNANVLTNLIQPLSQTDIPTVMGSFADSENPKFVNDPQKPGGNITGVKSFTSDILDKAFTFLNKNIAPINNKKAVFITNPGPFKQANVKETLNGMGIELKDYKETTIFEEYQEFVTKYENDPDVGWVLYGLTPWTLKKDGSSIQRSEFIDWHLKNTKKPNISYWESAVRNFMLCGIAVDLDMSAYQSGEMAVKILNGEKVGDIPLQEPKKTNIVLNKKRAEETGIEFSLDAMGSAYKTYIDYAGNFKN
jgi:putative ABC transport system substrate-binding protein